jgi:hypothetical protein
MGESKLQPSNAPPEGAKQAEQPGWGSLDED